MVNSTFNNFDNYRKPLLIESAVNKIKRTF